ncbi:MAG: chemotaxis response regulator protein-glutamate methylesterase [Alphaproteobacteria bacterium]|jgi:two-component system chemotaxis response regulator CheB|nr:chemotaxis response regulator protein-glutamate methylesterase [Alphaproteobacteria bacterium]
MAGSGKNISGPVRVMVVDDSSIVRGFLTRFLETDPGIKVTAAVPNGQAALQELDEAAPDVVILDLEMPVMDGVTALPLLLAAKPTLPVIVASTKTRENAALALKCLALGAIDCLGKPNVHDLSDPGPFRDDLVQRVKILGRLRDKSAAPAPFFSDASPPKVVPRTELQLYAPAALAICASTGGPVALLKILAGMKPLSVPVFITQHMPAHFTALLAENITQSTGLDCREGVDGEAVTAGRVYIAPGNYHLTVQGEDGNRRISLNQNPPEHFCRPAADPMLRSLAASYTGKLLVAVLTGMGTDAVAGCRAVVNAGGAVVTQDESSSVVWGMPGAVVSAGLSAETVPLDDMAATLIRRLKAVA